MPIVIGHLIIYQSTVFKMIELYTPKETAIILKINYRKVLDMIHLKKLGAYKIGSDYRIPIHEIHNYLEKVKTK